MSLSGPRSAPLRLASIFVLMVSLIVGVFFGNMRPDRIVTGHEQAPDLPRSAPDIAQVATPPPAADTLVAKATPPPSTPPPAPTPTPAKASATELMGPEELVEYQPNELGVVPILEYHVITTNPDEVAQFVRLADDMRADLQWLYDHNFYIVPLRDVVNNTIQVPAGKHPVALTFDDGTSTQFAFIENAEGGLVPDPDTAIGILEAFYAEHPDFGRGGHFAPLVFNAFAEPDTSQKPYFDQKIHWMVERGYEIGNHTWQHTNLTDIPTDEFLMTVSEPMIWADQIIGDVPENASRILTLPYGTTPDGDLHPDQRKMMRHGFEYKGVEYHLKGALLVGADPAFSPASTQWDPMWIPRIQMFDESVDFWFGMFETGGSILYTSDGNPDTIVVPSPLPPSLEGHLDVAALTKAGKTVIQYDPETGAPVAASLVESGHLVADARIQREYVRGRRWGMPA